MDRGFLVRLFVPVLALAALLLGPYYLTTAGPASLLGAKAPTDYAQEDFTAALPDGVGRLSAAVAGGLGPLVIGESSHGRPIIAAYDGMLTQGSPALTYLPAYYAAPDLVAQAGSFYLVAGQTLGSSPALGVYNAAKDSFADATDVLPGDVNRVEMVVGGSESFLVLARNQTALVAATLDPSGPTLTPLEVPELAAFAGLRHGVWNGSAFYLAGEGLGGEALLRVLHPSTGNGTDLSALLPEDVTRIDRLVWSGEDLYVLGALTSQWTPLASLTVYQPGAGSMASLSDTLPVDCEELLMAAWNGSALFLLARVGGLPTLLTYHPVSRTSVIHDEVLPSSWTYRAMIPQGDVLAFLGENITPVAGVLRTDTWSWEEPREALGSAYQGIHDLETDGAGVLVSGTRASGASLARLDLVTGRLEDVGRDLNLPEGALLTITKGPYGFLLAGHNESGALLYEFDPAGGRVNDLTSLLPEEVRSVYRAAWNGRAYAIPGSASGRPYLMVYDPQTAEMEDLSRTVQRYLREVVGATSFGDSFLLFGSNDEGAAMATLTVETGRITYVGGLGGLYGRDGVIHSAAWSGKVFMVGGVAASRPILGLWSPGTESFRDLSAHLPADVKSVHHVAWAGRAFYAGGIRANGGALIAFVAGSEVPEDLSLLLPPAASLVSALEPSQGRILVASLESEGGPRLGALATAQPVWPLPGLPLILRDPTSALLLGLSSVLVAVLAYQLGQRERKKEMRMPPPPFYRPDLYTPPQMYPEDYVQYVPEEGAP